jgi:agmatinase
MAKPKEGKNPAIRNTFTVFEEASTFLRAPRCSLEDIKNPEKAVVVIGIPLNNPVGLGDCRLAPRTIREATDLLGTYLEHIPGGLIDVNTGHRIRPLPEPRIFDLGNIAVDRIFAENNNQIIKEAIQRICEIGALPLILGGDHYITFPAFWGASEGLAKGRKKFKMGYIQMDAHIDLFDEYPSLGKYNMGTTARRISELAIIEIPNMVWIGTRGFVRPAEGWDYIRSKGGRFLTMNEIRARGIKDVAKEALEVASKGCDAVYITIDMDVVDSPFVQGITYPEFGGISGQDLIDAMTIFRDSPAIRAVDVVEVCPTKEMDPRDGLSSRLAATALIQLIAPKVFNYQKIKE